MANSCSCKYCLCCFNVAVIVHLCTLGVLVSTYIFFGSMPPFINMAVGFWLLVYTNLFAMYVCLLAEAVYSRHDDIWWINKLTRIGILVCLGCYLAGAVLFLLPVSSNSMMDYCKVYFKVYKEIPPSLDTMQEKYACCGINNYLDYGLEDFCNSSYGKEGFYVYREANENDEFFLDLVKNKKLNRTVARKTTGLDLPQSCCVPTRAKNFEDKDCGKKVEYTDAEKGTPLWYAQENSAREKVNDPTMGCYQKYYNINEVGNFQITYLLGVIQFMAVVQGIICIGLLWVQRTALKTIRQINYWLPELLALHDDDLEHAEIHAGLEAEADLDHVLDEKLVATGEKRKENDPAVKNKPAETKAPPAPPSRRRRSTRASTMPSKKSEV